MNKNKKIIWWVAGVIVVVVIVLVAARNQSGQSGNPIKVGVAVGKTGDAGEWGEVELNVYELVANQVNQNGGINGRPLDLLVEDTASTEVGTANAVSKLINVDNVPVILGPTWADSFQSGNPIADKAQVVMLSPSTAIDVVKAKSDLPYFFSTWWSQGPEASAIEKYMSASISKIDIINDQDPWDTNFADIVAADASKYGLTVVDREQVPIGTQDFRTILAKIKNDGSQGIFLQIQDPLGVGAFMKQNEDLQVGKQVYSTSEMNNQDVVDKFGSAVEGLIYSYPHSIDNQVYETLLSDYQNAYHVTPTASSFTNAYNAIEALVAALRSGAMTGTQIKDALHQVSIPGAGIQTVSFDASGAVNNAQFEIRTIKNGQFTTVTVEN